MMAWSAQSRPKRVPNTAMGSMRHRVIVQKQSRVTDSMGGVALTWSEFSNTWCNIRPASGREEFAYMQKAGTITHVITLRHLPGLNASMRFQYGLRVFNINAVMDMDERNRFMRCLCTENRASATDETQGQ